MHQLVSSTMYHKKCINHAPNLYHNTCINHAPNLYHNKCINHEPTLVPNRASTMYINMCQSYTISCHTPYTNKPRYEPTMYLTNKTLTSMYHASNDVPGDINQITQTHSSSMLLNITKMQPHNIPSLNYAP
jgi:hypothetical protein